LSTDSYIPSAEVKRLVTPLVTELATDDLLSMPEIPRCPPIAIAAAATAMLRRGDPQRALTLAEVALDRRNPLGWSETWDGGSVLDLLRATVEISPARARDLAFAALGGDIAAGEVAPSMVFQNLDTIVPFLTDDPPESVVWPALESYLDELLALSMDRPLPDLDGPRQSFDQALAAIAVRHLRHPVSIVAQLSRETLSAEVVNRSPAVLEAVESVLRSPVPGAIQAVLGVLEAANGRSPAALTSLRDQIEPLLSTGGVDVRLAARRLLGITADLIPSPPTDPPPLVYRIELPIGPSGLRRRVGELAESEPLPDTSNAIEIVQAFDTEVQMLARWTSMSPMQIANRTVEIVRSIGLGDALRSGEEARVRANLDSIGMEYTFVRPRSAAVRVALGMVTAELLDHRYLGANHTSDLDEMFRSTDPGVDNMPLATLPAWLHRPIRSRRPYVPLTDWVQGVKADPRPLPSVANGSVVASWAQLASLEWGKPTELRQQTLVTPEAAGGIIATLEDPSPSFMAGTSDYLAAGGPDDPPFLLMFPVRYSTMKGPWLALNPWIGKQLGWRQHPGGVARWAGPDGELRLETIVWLDGLVDAPPADFDNEAGAGSYVVATPDAIAEIEDLFGPHLAVEIIERTALDDGKRLRHRVGAHWDWRRLA
jgi:hypothetical protein